MFGYAKSSSPTSSTATRMITAPIHFRIGAGQRLVAAVPAEVVERLDHHHDREQPEADRGQPVAVRDVDHADRAHQHASSAATRPFTQENGVGVSSSATVTPQERRDLQGQRLRGVEDVGVPPEAVHLAEVAGADDRHALLGEPVDEALALVAQRVVLGGDDQRRRQGAEPVGEQRREVGVGQVGGRRGVLPPVPRGLARVEARRPRWRRTSNAAVGSRNG